MLGKIFNLSACALLLGMVACEKETAGITEEGNSIAEFDLWNGTNGNGGFNSSNGALARWYSVDDEENGGNSQIKFPTVDGNELTPDNVDSLVSRCGGLCGTVELGETSAPSAGVGIALTENETAIDISGWDGICVSYESELPMKGLLGYKNDDAGSSNDLPAVEFERTENGISASRCAKWTNFVQKSLMSNSGVEASKKATSIIFKFFGNARETGFFNIKGVSSYKHGVENLDSIKIVEPAKIDTGACLWNGTIDKPGYFVNNDSNGVTGGYWYSYNDRTDGGGSLLYWSAEAPNYRTALEWITEDDVLAGGFSVKVSLDKGNASKAYAGVGVKMVVRDSATAEYSAAQVNLHDWDGICVYYMAEKDMRVVLLNDTQESEHVLEASATSVRKCIAWNEMSNPGVESSATDIRFEVGSDENVYSQIQFNIIAIERYTTTESCVIESSNIDSISAE